jgi:putative serine protease PepD
MRAAAVPTVAGVRYAGPSTPTRPRTSRLAVASLLCAIAGIPFFGLITGVVAIVLAGLALGEIQRDERKGKSMAIAGLFLGLADTAGWIVLLAHLMGGGMGGGRSSPRTADFRLDPHQLDALPAPIARAMRANVLLTGHRGIAGEVVGSGIILRIAEGQAQILTNRHVVDPGYDADSSSADVSGLKPLEVALVDQSISQGHVVWLAPGAIDLALVSAPCVSAAARAAAWPATRPSGVADPVFAIGNPHAWGWTHTQGSISQIRYLAAHGNVADVRVIQTTAPINPGNSGGGLYDRDGFLIGINTWTNDKSTSEGLSFSIAFDAFLGLSPPVSKDAADLSGNGARQAQQEKRP